MSNLGIWLALSLLLFSALTSRLRGPSQTVAVWVYLWGIGGLWGVSLWHNYQRYLSFQKMDLDQRGAELLSQNALVLWISVGLILFLMALPPIWCLHDRRKTRRLNAG